MKIYIDSDTNTLIGDPNFKVPLQGVTFKRGDSATVEIIFVTGFVPLSAVGGIDLIFGAKLPGVYDGDFIVYEDDYTTSGNSYVMKPSFNTVEIDGLLGSGNLSAADVASLTLSLEITWSLNGTDWASSNIIPLVINNDIIKGIEGTPLSLSGNPTTWLEDDAQPEYITFENGAILAHDANNNITFGVNVQTYEGVTSSLFMGNAAGSGATDAASSNFLGNNAGLGATDAYQSNFLGDSAGVNAANANSSNFIGGGAGVGATNASSSNFFGNNAGYGATGANGSNFIGAAAGYGATGANRSIFLGTNSGTNIVTGTKNICIGSNTGADTTTLSAISGCIILGDSAKATASNQLVLGSAETPLSVIAGGSLASSLSGLKVNINGTVYTIPLLA